MSSARLPLSQMETNAARQLAEKWLRAMRMDVNGLNRDCRLSIDLDGFYNRIETADREFVPIYVIRWQLRNEPDPMKSCAANVKLFLPEEILMSLAVRGTNYNRRATVVLTNALVRGGRD